MTGETRGYPVCADCEIRHRKAGPCPTCALCGGHASHHHRNSRHQVLWCVATDATWPLEALVVKAGGAQRLCERMGMSPGSMVVNLTDTQSDEWAVKCGWHPEQVWPGWIDAGLRHVDAVYVNEGGWRHAWLNLSPTRLEKAA